MATGAKETSISCAGAVAVNSHWQLVHGPDGAWEFSVLFAAAQQARAGASIVVLLKQRQGAVDPITSTTGNTKTINTATTRRMLKRWTRWSGIVNRLLKIFILGLWREDRRQGQPLLLKDMAYREKPK